MTGDHPVRPLVLIAERDNNVRELQLLFLGLDTPSSLSMTDRRRSTTRGAWLPPCS
jgi:hypothetical protein